MSHNADKIIALGSRHTSISLLVVLPILLAIIIMSSGRPDIPHSTTSAFVSTSHSADLYSALMAPLLFPQLYPGCGRVDHPTPPDGVVLSNYSKSQHGEDTILYDKFFSNYTSPGVFLEIGALNGVLYSNTFSFEHALGWRGMLVEAHPSNGVELRKANRSRAAIFTSAVCDIPDMATPGELRFSVRGGAVATDVDHAAPSFLEKWGPMQGDGYVLVPCVPLQYFIDATGLWDIDFFSLDVEGSEKIVLQTVDLKKTNIKLLMVELDKHDPKKNEWVREHLKQAGFEHLGADLMINKSNEVFLNRRFEERKAARPPLPIQCG